MKKLTIALALAGFAGGSHAVTIYDNSSTKVDIQGYLGVHAIYDSGYDANGSVSKQDASTKLEDRASRIRFAFQTEFVPKWTAGAQLEWGFNPVNNKGDLFTNRLGNVFFSHKDGGTIRVGKQWSAFYDIAGWTDVLYVWGGDASGTYDGRAGHGDSGMGRADEAATYRHSFGGFNLGLQYQFEQPDTARDSGYQASLSYDLSMGLSLGATYAASKYDNQKAGYVGDPDQQDAKSWLAGLKYDSDYVYLSGVYGQYENLSTKFSSPFATVADKAKGVEVVAFYKIQQGLYQLYAAYSGLEDDTSGSQGKWTYAVLGAAWKPQNVLIAFQYKFGMDYKLSDGSDVNVNQASLQARYFF